MGSWTHFNFLLYRLRSENENDFLIENGKLYLKVQMIHHGFIDDTVSRLEWTPEKLSVLLQGHPDLTSYLPDSQKSDGGIVWLKTGK
jgi:hypothetical protein